MKSVLFLDLVVMIPFVRRFGFTMKVFAWAAPLMSRRIGVTVMA